MNGPQILTLVHDHRVGGALSLLRERRAVIFVVKVGPPQNALKVKISVVLATLHLAKREPQQFVPR